MDEKRTSRNEDESASYSRFVQRTGLLLGPVILLTGLLTSAPSGMSTQAWYVAALGLHMAVWWMTEAVPIPVTSLLPLVVLPVLGVGDIGEVAAPYSHPLIYLFLGGFIIAEAVQCSGVHKRVALELLNRTGDSPGAVTLAFMAITAFGSMWMSNTATTLMMLPIGISVVDLAASSSRLSAKSVKSFGTLLMLGIAYSASVGGIGTLIGTPPNALMAAFLEETYGIEIGFAEWMIVGVPVVIIGIPLIYFVLGRILFKPSFASIPGGRSLFREELTRLGRMSSAEKRVGLVFLTVALLWMTRPLLRGFVPGLSDSGIAVLGAISLFIIPVRRHSREKLLSWKSAVRIPWGVLLLFGGGLSLAAFISSTGLAGFIGESIGGLSELPPLVITFLFVVVVIVLTEMTSNTATTAAFLPVLGSVAVALDASPLSLVVPATIAASCAFLLPVATAPNAIVFGTGYIRISSMARAGVYLNLGFAVIITLLSMFLGSVPLG
jgi:solute carrier family 13 (sodium-dependent dicarboxylate transporter), member 2/3/5